MAVLEVLAEMVCSEKLLGRIALAELVYFLKVLVTLFYVLFSRVSRHHTSIEGPVAWA